MEGSPESPIIPSCTAEKMEPARCRQKSLLSVPWINKGWKRNCCTHLLVALSGSDVMGSNKDLIHSFITSGEIDLFAFQCRSGLWDVDLEKHCTRGKLHRIPQRYLQRIIVWTEKFGLR